MSDQATKATFVTFYSFKGGVGRSMAVINTAAILAGQQGFRVLVIDVDLEAPGLSYLDPAAPDEPEAQAQRELPLVSGFVDLLSDAKTRGEEADLFTLSSTALAERYTRNIHIPQAAREVSGGSLRVMPAGRLDAGYGSRLSALNLGQLYADGIGEPLVRAFKTIVADSGLYDYVLVDSRTGLSEEAGMCTRELADHLMIVSGLNRQNVEGTSEFLRAFRKGAGGNKKVQIILSPVPNGEDELFQRREDAARSAFEAAWEGPIDLSLQIPYHPQLALTEEPHIFRRRKGYLFQAYRAIERSLLRHLRHTSDAFHRRVIESLGKREYAIALSNLRHMVRLDGGRRMLANLAERLSSVGRKKRVDADSAREKEITVDGLLDYGGMAILEFVVAELSIEEHDWTSYGLASALERKAPELADTLFQRIVEAFPDEANHLAGYAAFSRRIGNLDRAEHFYLRALEAAPEDPANLGNFANFLTTHRRDSERAEEFYRRALAADPENAINLTNFANFLADKRRDLAQAEEHYRRALAAEPEDVTVLGTYAAFLMHYHGDFEQAEQLSIRALELDPEAAATLGDYGQLLIATGRFADAEVRLQSGFDLESDTGNRAEFSFGLWLAARLQGHDGVRWERQFKSLIEEGFVRYPWSFDQMLGRAEEILTADECDYARALAAAFLDEKKVAALASYPRWTALEVPPKLSRRVAPSVAGTS